MLQCHTCDRSNGLRLQRLLVVEAYAYGTLGH